MYFDQLSGAMLTQKLVEIFKFFFLLFKIFSSIFIFFIWNEEKDAMFCNSFNLVDSLRGIQFQSICHILALYNFGHGHWSWTPQIRTHKSDLIQHKTGNGLRHVRSNLHPLNRLQGSSCGWTIYLLVCAFGIRATCSYL